MTEKITVGGMVTHLEHATTLARDYLTQYGNWSYPAYDAYPGNGDPDTVGPPDCSTADRTLSGLTPRS